MSSVNVQLLLTGNELMMGDIVDSNSSMIAQELKSLGIYISRKVAVADEIDALVFELTEMSKRADILIVNGGLGPTVDDLTAQALAKVMNVELHQHPDALTHINAWCQRRNVKLNAPNLKQTFLPVGCSIVANKFGSAVGFKALVNNCTVYCTPGVPSELATMLSDEIKSDIASIIPANLHYQVSRFQVFGLGESSIQKLLDEQCPDWPEEIELGFRASVPLLEVKLTTRTIEAEQIKPIWVQQLHKVLGDHIIAEIKDKPLTLAKHLQHLLLEQKVKITTAESCTGGMIASAITEEAHSSEVFEAGFVVYANHIKTSTLNVDANIIETHGAVSEQTVRAMALGALEKSGADYVIATSGIAGPGGGSVDKPVGTVWIAWGTQQHLKSICLLIPESRHFFQQYVTAIGFDLTRRMLLKTTAEPSYIKERAQR